MADPGLASTAAPAIDTGRSAFARIDQFLDRLHGVDTVEPGALHLARTIASMLAEQRHRLPAAMHTHRVCVTRFGIDGLDAGSLDLHVGVDALGTHLSDRALDAAAPTILRAWQRQRWQPSPVLVQLTQGRVQVLRRAHGDAIASLPFDPGILTSTGPGSHDATSALSLPWCTPAGEPRGLMTIEASGTQDASNPWENVWLTLATFVAALGPHLDHLPLAQPGPAPEAPGIPVVGNHLAARLGAWQRFTRYASLILIEAPAGTETLELARWLHHSGDATGAFVAPDRIDSPRDLAHAIHRAADGTLIVPNVESLNLDTQAVLLHFIETREYVEPDSGAIRSAPALRLIPITRRDLAPLAHAGHFHPMLHRALTLFSLRLPPLADRPDEIPAWSRHALAAIDRSASVAAPRPALDRQALTRLVALPWPGNQAELNWVVRRAWFEALADAGARVGATTRVSAAHIDRALDAARSGGDSLLERSTRLAGELLLHPVTDGAHDELMEFLRTQNLLFSLLWRAAARHYDGDRSAMAEALTRVSALKNRNFQKEMDAAYEKLCRFAAFLGEAPPEEFNRPD